MPNAIRRLLPVLLVLLPLCALRAQSITPAIRAWREQHEVQIVRELTDLVAIPNVATDSVNIRRNVALLRAMLERRGAVVRVIESGGPPVVLGEIRTPGATRTIGLYAHYDGQPVDPREWTTPAWQPTLRAKPTDTGAPGAVLPLPSSGRFDPESRLYARSASDDKGPIIAMLSALDALRATAKSLTVNVKFFFDGEEEANSSHLSQLVERESAALQADAWFFADGPAHQSRQQQIVFGARGTMGLEMTVYGPARALHSGHYGNWAPNPGMLLVDAIASMRDADGRILIDHFMDDVTPPTAADRAAARALPVIDTDLKRALLLGASESNNALLAERILLPAVNLRGLRTGQVGALASNAIPTLAQASFDFRLVPHQTPQHIRELVEAHLTARGWFIAHAEATDAERLAHAKVMRLEWGGGYPAVKTSMDLAVSKAIRAVVTEAMGAPALAAPLLGGSLPISSFAEVLKAPLVILPTVNHDNAQHAKDENLRLQNLWDAIDIFAAVFVRLAPAWQSQPAQ